MKRFVAVVAREVVERANVLVVGAVMAATPYLWLLASMQREDRVDALRVTAIVLAAAFAIVLSVILGATMIASDASARRLSFYMAKPLPAATLWFGKLTANSLVVAAVAAAIARAGLSPPAKAFFALAFIPLLIAVAHAASMLIRARGAGAIAAIVGLAIATAGAAGGRAWSLHDNAFYVSYVMVAWWVVALIVAFLVAGAGQVREAAWDVRAGSRALQRTIAKWLVIGGAVLSALYAAWLVVGTPFHGPVFMTAARSGPWAEVVTFDPLRLDYFRAGMLNLETGARIPLRIPARSVFSIVASADGRDLFANDESGALLRVRTGLLTRVERLASSGFAIAVSDDGSHVAVDDAPQLSIIDVATRRPCWSASVLNAAFVRFDHGGGARVVHHEPAGLRVVQLDARCRVLATWSVPLTFGDQIVDVRDDGAILTRSGGDWQLFDAHLHLLRKGGADRGTTVAFIDDGRIVTFKEGLMSDGSITIVLMSRDGTPLRSMVFPWRYVQPCTAFSRSFVVVNASGSNVLIDVEHGVARTLRGLTPVAVSHPAPLARGSAASVFQREQGGIVRLDPVTGRTTVIYDAPPFAAWQRGLIMFPNRLF